MLTTTPRFKPLLGAMPKPASLSSAPGNTSATTTMTLLVPISNPTTKSLYSFAMETSLCLPCCRRIKCAHTPQAQGIAIDVS